MIIDPRRACVEIQRRAGELWTLHGHYERNDSAELSSVGLRLSLQDVYEEVDFPDLQALIVEMERDAAAEDPDAK